MRRTRHLNPYLLKKAADHRITRAEDLPRHELKELAAQALQADLEDGYVAGLEELLLGLDPSELQMIGRYLINGLLYENSESFELAGRVIERSIMHAAVQPCSPIQTALSPKRATS